MPHWKTELKKAALPTSDGSKNKLKLARNISGATAEKIPAYTGDWFVGFDMKG